MNDRSVINLASAYIAQIGNLTPEKIEELVEFAIWADGQIEGEGSKEAEATAEISVDRNGKNLDVREPQKFEGQPSAKQIRDSITPEWLWSFEDGRRYKSLRRPLARLGLTPEEYRKKYGLPENYPMVAPNFSAKRSELARRTGLGKGRDQPKK